MRVGAALMARQGRNADGIINMLCGGLCTQCSSQIVELLAADVVLKDYPDAVEDMRRYLAAAAVEGAALSHEKLLAIYPEFVVTPDHVEFGCAKSEPFSPEAKAALSELRQTLANC